jgi:iron complex transport system substrate-binding protein
MKKYISILLLATLFLAACSTASGTASTETTTPSATVSKEATSDASSSFPVTIKNCGNTLTFDAPPKRAVTMYSNIAEILLRLGLENQIIGTVSKGNTEPVWPPLADAYARVPAIETSNYGVPREIMLAAQPDFVFGDDPTYYYDAANGFATPEELKAIGAQIYTLTGSCKGSKSKVTIDDFYTDILNIGKIFNVPGRAEVVVAEMRQQIAAVQKCIAGRKPVRFLLYGSGEGPLSVFGGTGSRTVVPELAGGQNIFSDLAVDDTHVSIETTLERNPDAIVVIGVDGGPSGMTGKERAELAKKLLPTTTAVQNGNVFVIPNQYLFPSVSNADGVKLVAQAFYPDACGK